MAGCLYGRPPFARARAEEKNASEAGHAHAKVGADISVIYLPHSPTAINEPRCASPCSMVLTRPREMCGPCFVNSSSSGELPKLRNDVPVYARISGGREAENMGKGSNVGYISLDMYQMLQPLLHHIKKGDFDRNLSRVVELHIPLYIKQEEGSTW